MGQSTDGILVYGWDLGDPDAYVPKGEPQHWAADWLEEFLDADDDDEFLAAALGTALPERGDDYSVRRAAIDALPLEVIRHCHSDYPMYLLAHRQLNWRVYRGHVEDVDEIKVLSWQEHDAELWAAMAKLGLTPPLGPKLLMASYWG